jgi:hypothetical protein
VEARACQETRQLTRMALISGEIGRMEGRKLNRSRR